MRYAFIIGLFFILKSTVHREVAVPNIIYILADDLGYGDISAYNAQSKIKTNHIDALAQSGLRFTDAHSGSAVCSPTRYGVLTGRYAWRTWMKQGVLWSWDKPLIDSNRVTVGSLLQRAGYRTGCVGKWHLGLGWQQSKQADYDVRLPLTQSPLHNGFNYFYGITASLDIPPYVFIENNESTSQQIDTIAKNDGKAFWRRGPIGHDFEMEQVLPHFQSKALEFISRAAKSSNPFFLYFPLPAPHTPILPTPNYQGKSNTNEYGDFVLMIDDMIGEIVKRLKTENIYDNTIIIFTSDNGCSPMADFDELAQVGHDPSGIFRGHKADIYEGGHRVPFIVHWPEQIQGAYVSDEMVCLTDLLATCADIVDLEIQDQAGEDSYSFLPALFGNPIDRKNMIHHSINGSFAFRQVKWKLIFAPGSGGWSDPLPKAAYSGDLPLMQLYDLDSDPEEKHNLVEEYPEVVQIMTNEVQKIIDNGRSTNGPVSMNDEPVDLFYAKSKMDLD